MNVFLTTAAMDEPEGPSGPTASLFQSMDPGCTSTSLPQNAVTHKDKITWRLFQDPSPVSSV